MKHFWKKAFSALMMALILTQCALPALAEGLEGDSKPQTAQEGLTPPATKEAAQVTVEGSTLYANGVPIVLKGSEDKRAYVYDTDGNKLSENKISTVYGGGKNADVDGNVHIVVEDAYLSNIYGGGYSDGSHSANVSGSVTIDISGTKVANVYGGGFAQATKGEAHADVMGNIVLNINSIVPRPNEGFTEAGHRIMGGGEADGNAYNATAKVRDVYINSGGPIYAVRGGGSASVNGSATGTSEANAGNITIEINNGDIREVYCGGYAAHAGATANVENTSFVGNNCEIMSLDGGGSATGGSACAGDVSITLNDCPNLYGYIQGGGTARSGGQATAGKVTMTIINSAFPPSNQWGDVVAGRLCGGGSASDNGSVADVGDTSITMEGGVHVGAILGGGDALKGASASSENTTIKLSNIQGQEFTLGGKTALYRMTVVGGAEIDANSKATASSISISIQDSALDLVLGGNSMGGVPVEPACAVSLSLGKGNKGLQGVAHIDNLELAVPISLQNFLPGKDGTVLIPAGDGWISGAAVLSCGYGSGEDPSQWITQGEDEFAFEQTSASVIWKLKGLAIGGTRYLTLEEATKAAQSGDIIKLLSNIKLGARIVIDKPLTIEGENKTITGPGATDAAKHNAFAVVEEGNLTLKDANIEKTHTAIRLEGAGAVLAVDNCKVDSKYYAIGARNINQNISVANSTLSGWAGIMTSAGSIGLSENTQTKITVKNSVINANTLDTNDGYGGITLQENFHKVTLDVSDSIFNIAKNGSLMPSKMAAIWVRAFGSRITATNCVFNLSDGASTEQGVLTVTRNTVKGNEEAAPDAASSIVVSNAVVNANGEYKEVTFVDTSNGSTGDYRTQDFVRFNHMVYVSCVDENDKISLLKLNLDGGTLDEVTVADNEVTLPKPIRSGFNFVNWKDEQGIEHAAESKIIITKDTGLTATWSAASSGGGEFEGNPVPPPKTETETKTEGDVTTETTTTIITKQDGSKTIEKSEMITNAVTGEKTEVKSTQTVANDGSVTTEETKVTSNANGTKTEEKVIASMDAKTGTSSTTTIKTDESGKSQAEVVVEGGKDAKEAAISGNALKAAAQADQAIMTIKTSVATISFDAKAIATIAGASGEKVKVSTVAVDAKTLPTAAPKTLKDAKVLELSIIGGKGDISSFEGGTAVVEVPYVKENSAKSVAVFYVDASGKTTRMVGSYYDAKSRSVRFQTGHFSYYAILEEDVLQFADVSDADWYYDAVRHVVANKLFDGISPSEFAPNSTMTRGMLATVLYRMENEPAVEDNSKFADVSSTRYYASAVAWAAACGIVEGFEGNFNPDDSITREQLATVLYRYAKYKNYDVHATGDLSSFADAGQVSAYALDAMTWICASGVMEGSDGSLLPKNGATRAQASALLMRFDTEIAK